ncbi:copper resistance protein CopC [Myceligenerans pegani]|uniref:Copper resistance protein CopC n=1 Tax=Myceligenerans pegani TaxID=2776917 RepID=A0ABR9N3X9_9MICO|nr:copper resistance protein CopC [Myceligenerans sp. TRM 65318]MBE1877976.1 copper resistance protein CopC [Myceligenerans sp. TRM 65318]MBE3020247.1 copper resistance protein CopC [Myceligenerans sp. TRM 65318]
MPEVVTPADSRAATGPRAGVRIAVLLVAACVACLSVAGIFLIASPPASAHDQLLSSDPADGDELDAMPEAIALTFSGEPLATGAEVVLTGEDGTPVALHDLTVDGVVLTASTPSTLPGGEYDVAWHIVSGDGHPLEGAFSFTVDAPGPSGEPTEEPAQEEPSEGAAGGTEPAEDAEQPAGAADDAAVAPGTPAGIPSGVAALAVFGGLAVVVVVLVVRWRRMENDAMTRKRGRGGDSAGGGSADGSSDGDGKSSSAGGDSGSGGDGGSGGGD